MTVKETRQALGDWSIVLRESTPQDLIATIEANKFGHIAIIPGRINPKLYNDGMLSEARYVGVYRSIFKQSDDTTQIKGVGMAMWLGDEDGKGDIFETAVILTAQSFANSVRALLPPNGAITEGTLFSVPGAGTYTGRHQWETSRDAITYVTDTFSTDDQIVEWRVNGDGTLDAGPIADLYEVNNPKAILVKNDTGRDMRLLGLAANASLDYDVEDLTTRVVLLAQGEGTTIATGSADATPTGFKDIHGNAIAMTRLVSESETSSTNATVRAQNALRRWQSPRQAVQINTAEFDVKGDFVVGDYIWVYDQEAGFLDLDNQVYWKGQVISPVALRVVEMGWPIRAEWTVAFRTKDGDWLDLSQYYRPETGGTQIVVGDYRRTLAGNNYEPIGFRPNLPEAGTDSTIPGEVTWGDFSTGNYQSDTSGETKSAVLANWTQPLNGDGSTITDGSHYEIRYRIVGYVGYPVRWGQVDGIYRWGELSTNLWGAPLTDPVQDPDKWNNAIVNFEFTEFWFMELTPGVQYQFQIRAVDLTNNVGPWSDDALIVASGDLFAPSQPAAPEVAASRIAIQVTHLLGKSDGGTFNLEADLNHLEIHVGGTADFQISDTSRIGKLIATGGMVLGQIPAVGTFQIENTEEVWVKVVAVDNTGNKSTASDGVQQTVELIDDAHISDLTVSKVTAGTITATWVNAGRIATASSGPRLDLEDDGLNAYDNSGFKSIFLSGVDSRMTFYKTPYVYGPVEIGNTSVDGNGNGGGYGVRVQDLYSNTRLILGEIDPNGDVTDVGNYGLAGVNSLGQLVKLTTIMFGRKDSQTAGTTCTSGTYVDGTTNFGPQVTDVEVGQTGQVIVHLSAAADFTSGDVVSGASLVFGGHMSFEVIDQGNNQIVLSASDDRAAGFVLELPLQPATSAGDDFGYEASISASIPIVLDPGIYKFTAKFRNLSSGTGFSTIFRIPYMIVEPR